MTKSELLNLPHLKIARETIFVHVHTEDGWILTSWNDGDDIKEYSGGACYYMPIRDTYDDYRLITVDEHDRLTKLSDEAIREYNERERESINDRENE